MLLLQRGDYGWALVHCAAHLFGALACCIAGFATWRAFAS
jgi:CrcB protein